ncbi:hypothetical protein TcG_12873 [Trypanosoma cruzi]|nr:hypothetical protein TcG_12873 [Trypanosoma cruzi]
MFPNALSRERDGGSTPKRLRAMWGGNISLTPWLCPPALPPWKMAPVQRIRYCISCIRRRHLGPACMKRGHLRSPRRPPMRIRLLLALSEVLGSTCLRRFGVVQARTGDRSGAHRSAHGF